MDQLMDDILVHFGVRGMKWGVRKDGPRGAIRRGATKANVALGAGSKAIKEGEARTLFLSPETRDKVNSATQNRVLAQAVQVNRDPRFKGKDIKNNASLKKEYFGEIEQRAHSIYKEELRNARVDAWADLVETVLRPSGDSMSFKANTGKARHAEDDEVLLTLSFTRNQLGHIVGVEVVDDAFAQGEAFIDDFLAHFGVRGMKWGIRKRSTSPTPVLVDGRVKGSRVKVKTSGGERINPSEDAIKVAISKQKIRKSGTHALSNQELQAVVQRMNLEQQYSRLQTQNASPAAKFVRDVLVGQGKQQLQSVVNDYGNQVGKALKDK